MRHSLGRPSRSDFVQFEILAEEEMLDIDGGIFGVDDAIFWGLVGTGFAAGIATGISRKNRK